MANQRYFAVAAGSWPGQFARSTCVKTRAGRATSNRPTDVVGGPEVAKDTATVHPLGASTSAPQKKEKTAVIGLVNAVVQVCNVLNHWNILSNVNY